MKIEVSVANIWVDYNGNRYAVLIRHQAYTAPRWTFEIFENGDLIASSWTERCPLPINVKNISTVVMAAIGQNEWEKEVLEDVKNEEGRLVRIGPPSVVSTHIDRFTNPKNER